MRNPVLAVMLALAALLRSSVTLGQTAERSRGRAGTQPTLVRIGILAAAQTGEGALLPGYPRFEELRASLRTLGYREGETLILEPRVVDTGTRGEIRTSLEVSEDLRRLAQELVRAKVDLIIAGGSTEALMAQQASATVPIVFWSQEPHAEGLVDSYARPGRNATGITARREAAAENLRLARVVAPSSGPIGVLINPSYAPGVGVLRFTRQAAESAGIRLEIVEAHTPAELDGAFASLAQKGVGAVLVMNHGMFRRSAARLATLQLQYRLPVLAPYRETGEAGALISWMPDFIHWSRRAALYVDRILKGARPAELPVEESVPYWYTINLKTAEALGIRIPDSLLQHASRVIGARPGPTAAERVLVLTRVTVIDGTGAGPRPDMSVVVEGSRIREIGPSARVRVPEDAEVVDGTGKFLIPGLWDMHVHGLTEDQLRERFALLVAHGVTGVRHMAGDIEAIRRVRAEVAAGRTLGPRIVAAGPALGKLAWRGAPIMVGVGNAMEARQVVDSLAELGVDFIKASGEDLTREAYFAIAAQAKARGLAFAGHVPAAVSAAEASDAGQRVIEHVGQGVLEHCSTRETELRPQILAAVEETGARVAYFDIVARRGFAAPLAESYSPEKCGALFARFVRNETWLDPTLLVLRQRSFPDAVKADAPSFSHLPPEEGQRCASAVAAWRERPARETAAMQVHYGRLAELVSAMHRAGIPLLAGSDVGVPCVLPGAGLHEELALLVEAGLSPAAALYAATSNPARFLGAGDSLGTVEEGKIADLVLLDANPLEDIRNTRSVHAVVLRGRLLIRGELDRILAGAREAAARAAAVARSREPFVGTWRLLSLEQRFASGEVRRSQPVGLLMYDAGGRMSAQIMEPGRPAFATGDRGGGSPAELEAAFEGYRAYFGTFEVDESSGVIIHYPEGNLFPNGVGVPQRRFYEVTRERLVLRTPPIVEGGREFAATLVWQRVSEPPALLRR